ncbi:MAG: hypothetical protein V4726_14190 [Verrucomicrobiota bacterium]
MNVLMIFRLLPEIQAQIITDSRKPAAKVMPSAAVHKMPVNIFLSEEIKAAEAVASCRRNAEFPGASLFFCYLV